MNLIRTFSLVTATSLFLAFASAHAGAATTPPGYSPAQIAVIMDLRENGESLSDVAKIVGGTRQDVRAAEKAEKLRRKGERHGNGSRVVVAAR